MPRRQLEPSLLGLVDSEMEDQTQLSDEDILQSPEATTHDQPVSKTRGRPTAGDVKATKAKAPARKRITAPKKTTARKAAAPKRKALEEQVNGQDVEEEEVKEGARLGKRAKRTPAAHADASDVENVLDDLTGITVDPPKTKKTGKKPAAHKETTEDGQFDLALTGIRQHKMENRSIARAKKPELIVEQMVSNDSNSGRKVIPETQADDVDSDESYESVEVQNPVNHALVHEIANASRPRHGSRQPQPTATRRRAGSASDTERGGSDPALRRKLGDMTKKFENIDLKYRNLREVGVSEASANMEKLRKQCDAATNASNELIASMKKELATHAAHAQENRTLRSQLQSKGAEINKLQSKMENMGTSLTAAHNEIKSLQAKLAASRTGSVESANSKTPASSLKSNAQVRTIMVGSAEAAQAAQVAQLKEDLYSDLTGLIVRSVKKQDDSHMYDCIQTGRNGTLHFKLSLSQDSGSFDEAEFEYGPLLDANRDRDLLDYLPEYLTDDITFSRQHATQFYSRVVNALTTRERNRVEEDVEE